MNPLYLERQRNFRSKDFWINNLTSGSTRPFFSTWYHFFLSIACFLVAFSLVVDPLIV
jgi:hypothetical protein